MDPAPERRRHFRARVDGLRGTLRSPGDARVLDLSISGMRLETSVELPEGGRCFVELRRGGQTANVEGEIRWRSAFRVERTDDALRPVFRVGMTFVDILADGPGGLLDWLVPRPRG